MVNKDFNTLQELLKAFPDEQSCIDQLEAIRWNGNVVSPYDSTSVVYKCKGNKYRCKNTGKSFNVRTGTIYENSNVPLQKWFMAVWLITCDKKGVPSTELARHIGVTQKTAWFMLHRIRKCFGMDDTEPPLEEEVEVDETFMGGLAKNKHKCKRVGGNQGKSTKDKAVVFGAVQRNGKVRAKVVKDVSRASLIPVILDWVKPGSTIYSDENTTYFILPKWYTFDYVKHQARQYVDGKIYTNTIEGFWGILKKGMKGVYQFASRKHLQKYVDEFVFRYNIRKLRLNDAFCIVLTNMHNRITYKELIND